MPASPAVIAELYQAWKRAVDAHDAANPEHTVLSIGMSYFDIHRLGLEEGEAVIPSREITLTNDGGPTGNFRVICDGDHAKHSEEAQEPVQAVSGHSYRTEPVFA